jgi:hypothetical protein
VKERKISCPSQGLNPGCTAGSPSLYRLGYPGSVPPFVLEQTGYAKKKSLLNKEIIANNGEVT